MPEFFQYIGWTAAAVIAILLPAGIFRLARAVRSGAAVLRRAADITEHIDEEKSSSPRSLSSITGLVLPDIMRDFPEYNLELVLQDVKRDAVLYLESMAAGRCLFDGGVSPEFAGQTALEAGRRALPVSGGAAVHDAVIHRYISSTRDKVLEYQVSAEFTDGDTRRHQVRLELQYTAMLTNDVTGQLTAFTCPNCGAPVSRAGNKVCSYCGTALDVSASLCWTLISVSVC